MTTLLTQNSLLHFGFMPNAAELNRKIVDAYLILGEHDFIRRSHSFGGRFENLYIDRSRISAIEKVLEQAERYAREILVFSGHGLRSGFWINDMGPGKATSEHNHDDNDELLSGVYYFQVPANSGDLLIVDNHSRTLVTPQEGMFVFFSPCVTHSVNVNCSKDRRISMGMNFGPA